MTTLPSDFDTKQEGAASSPSRPDNDDDSDGPSLIPCVEVTSSRFRVKDEFSPAPPRRRTIMGMIKGLATSSAASAVAPDASGLPPSSSGGGGGGGTSGVRGSVHGGRHGDDEEGGGEGKRLHNQPSVRQAKKSREASGLMDSKDSVMNSEMLFHESERARRIEPPGLSHESRSRMLFDMFLFYLVLYNSILVPMEVASIIRSSVGLAAVNILVDICFFVDIVVNFVTPYPDGKLKDSWISDRKMMALNYLSGWFWVDFVASFPFGELLNELREIERERELERERVRE